MKERDLRYIGISVSWVSISVAGLFTLYAAKPTSSAVIIFLLWVISPYTILMLGELVIRKIAVVPKITKFFCVTTGLLLFFTVYAYLDVLGSKSSTSGLAFVFFPLYLNMLVVALVVIGLVWAAISTSSKK
jgi:hypothetical protein